VNNNVFLVEFPVLDGIYEYHVLINQPEDYIKTNLQSYITNSEVDGMMIGFMSGIVFRSCNGGQKWLRGGWILYIDKTTF
jgi:hypothetical protein